MAQFVGRTQSGCDLSSVSLFDGDSSPGAADIIKYIESIHAECPFMTSQYERISMIDKDDDECNRRLTYDEYRTHWYVRIVQYSTHVEEQYKSKLINDDQLRASTAALEGFITCWNKTDYFESKSKYPEPFPTKEDLLTLIPPIENSVKDATAAAKSKVTAHVNILL